VLDLLGKGTFGQVLKAVNVYTKDVVALKIVKNKPAYFNQGLIEVQILEMVSVSFAMNASLPFFSCFFNPIFY
jgi:serine/threonine protein kinase